MSLFCYIVCFVLKLDRNICLYTRFYNSDGPTFFKANRSVSHPHRQSYKSGYRDKYFGLY